MGLDVDALVRDASAFLQVPSVTGDERAALERLAEQAAALGLEADLHQHDLDLLRAHPDHPGEEAPRDELWGLTVTLPGTRPGRIAIDGHVDVVSPGTEPWRLGPWSGAIEDGRLHGRGSVDMKGPVVAALQRSPRCGARTPRGRAAGSSPPRKTAGLAHSPRSKGTRTSTPRCSPSRPAFASCAHKRAP